MSFSVPRRLADSDCMEGFTCGVPAIDGWLSKHARSSFKRGTAVVYVSFDELGRLAGFYTLSAHSIDRGSISGWLARNSPEQVPTILLGMLGVSVDHKREGSESSCFLMRIIVPDCRRRRLARGRSWLTLLMKPGASIRASALSKLLAQISSSPAFSVALGPACGPFWVNCGVVFTLLTEVGAVRIVTTCATKRTALRGGAVW